MIKNDIIIDSNKKNSTFLFKDALYEIICPIMKSKRTIVFLCIGSDRCTGDSLGPLVGDKLNILLNDKINVYGTLEHPVHAKNLCDTLTSIHNNIDNPFIIAIDACLGSIENIGKIFIKDKPLKPGASMNKNLPHVGDISITGIVNIAGTMDFIILQNTRLFTVTHLANIISTGIYYSILKIFKEQNDNYLKSYNTVVKNTL